MTYVDLYSVRSPERLVKPWAFTAFEAASSAQFYDVRVDVTEGGNVAD